MKKLLVICGPTAVGKTSIALRLAGEFSGELISADSRQVYKNMDIGTGKDVPSNFQFLKSNLQMNNKIGYYSNGNTTIWGYDMVDPKEDFSVAEFIKIAGLIIEDIWKRGKLPILVGGTGLYIKGIVDGFATASVPRNQELRKGLFGKSTSWLFQRLKTKDPKRALALNDSDRKNPRRLIRAIEIAHATKTPERPDKTGLVNKADVLFIGLKLLRKKIEERIDARVGERVKNGFEEEVKWLLDQGVSWENQSMSSLGYRQWRRFIEEAVSRKEVIEQWKKEEKRYAKRQMTWFNKDKRIHWFDVSKKGYQQSVEKLVKAWYSSEERQTI